MTPPRTMGARSGRAGRRPRSLCPPRTAEGIYRADVVDPTDAEIEARLAAAPAEAFAELWAAAAELAAEDRHGTWAGGEVVDTMVVDGVERAVRQMPYVERSPALDRVHTGLGRVGAIVPFDWLNWGGLARYTTADAVAEAGLADAVRLVTALVRADRFSEGSFLAAAEDGRLGAAIEVIRRWREA